MNKKILKLAIPNIISNLTVPFVGMVDVALMGRQSDPAYLGAIALGSTIFTIIYAGLGFLRMGTSGFTAQNRGARDIKNSYLILARALVLANLFALILLLGQNGVSWLAFHFINSSDQLQLYALTYFKIRIWAAPATLSLFAIMGWYIGMQDAKTPMWISILVNVSNIMLSSLFVLYYKMDVKGVALGTVIGQYLGLIFAFCLLLRHKKRFKQYWHRKLIFVWKEIATFMNLNKDILIRSLLLTGSFYYFNAASARLGDDVLAVNSVLLQFLWMFSYFIDGFAFAAEALTGKFVGAKSRSNLKLIVRKLFILGSGLSVFVSLIYWLFNSLIIRLLTTQPSVISLASDFKLWVIIMPLASFSAFIWDGIYIGATKGNAMRNAMVVSSLLIFIPSLILFRYLWGNHGMWLALILFMISRGFSLHLLFSKSILNKL